MNQQSHLLRISELLSRFSAQVSILNANSEYSINIHAENLLIKVLNELFDLDLKNINYTSGKMQPAIDLGDPLRRTAIQVTATADMKKVLGTIAMFNEKKLFHQYDRLFIYIITQKQPFYNPKKIKTKVDCKFIFTPEHIIDHSDVYKELNRQNDLSKINQILYLLEQQFTDRTGESGLLNGDYHDSYHLLPELPHIMIPAAPYISLKPYTEKEAAIFWGRGRQIRELYEAVFDQDCNPVILLYGQTGVGKSSLLDAGLIPRLKFKSDVRYKRRYTGEGLVKTLLDALNCPSVENIKEYLMTRQRNGKKLVLIIDQVEEAWTKPLEHGPDEIDQFLTTLKHLVMALPKRTLTVILGYRKEYHAEIDQQCIRYNLPAMTYFLQPIGKNGIKEIVNGPSSKTTTKKQYRLEIEAGLDDQIANDLVADPDSPVMPVLQILMTNLWDGVKHIHAEKRTISFAAYFHLKKTGYALSDFLNTRLQEIAQNYKEEVDSGLVLDLLFFFTTSLSTSDTHNKQTVLDRYDKELPIQQILTACVQFYLLTETKESSNNYSLAHDTLAPVIRSRFGSSELPGQKAHRILENRRADLMKDDLHPMSDKDFASVVNGRKGMRIWTNQETLLIEISGQHAMKFELQENLLSHIGMEIHDNIGQLLSVLKLQLEIIDERSDELAKNLHEIKQLVRVIVQDVAQLSRSLNPTYIQRIGFIGALQAEINKIKNYFNVQLEMSGDEQELNEKETLTLFRVCQESLNNILKHSKAKHISFKITFNAKEVSISIKDDGIGFDVGNRTDGGQGLKNMEYRIMVLQGEYTITSQPGSGCTTYIKLPLQNRTLKTS
ncbi:hypothetical protein A4R26_32955 [Niastella populi]|uniref:histidine kinase n=2 Tax=Niastella populi TaxID=550983 RepID=A0A1V9GAS3_9BACT|nr:hypothetical protein A4R26_32955 [Niastella populi]